MGFKIPFQPFVLDFPFCFSITVVVVVISVLSSLVVDRVAKTMSTNLLRLVPDTIQHSINESKSK
jgi:hypothetical protein